LNRKEELLEIFSEVDEKEIKLLNPLMDEVVFLEEQMQMLRKMPQIKTHPTNPMLQKKTEAAKFYKECLQSYKDAIRILIGVLNKIDNSAADELLKKLEEFA